MSVYAGVPAAKATSARAMSGMDELIATARDCADIPNAWKNVHGNWYGNYAGKIAMC